jgi:acetyl-CoA decarbonylase/synthase complex subunit gamma
VLDSQSPDEIKKSVSEADAFLVDYVGIDLYLDGYAVEAVSGDADTYRAAVSAVQETSNRPMILIAPEVELAKAGLESCEGVPLVYAADEDNWEAMAELVKESNAALVVRSDSLEGLAELTEKIKGTGLEDLVLDPMVAGYSDSLERLTVLRRLALKSNYRPLGYPIITFPGANPDLDETLLATEHITKYGGLIVLNEFNPASLYALLVLRQNIYTDPQKPIQVQPGVYQINSPDGNAPLMVTTNFSITYFSVANEVEGSGNPGWLLVADAEGMSVLTAWAAGKFDAERIAKDVKTHEVEGKVSHKKLILPGHVAVLSGELEEELPGWEILVGPREAVDLPAYIKSMWAN